MSLSRALSRLNRSTPIFTLRANLYPTWRLIRLVAMERTELSSMSDLGPKYRSLTLPNTLRRLSMVTPADTTVPADPGMWFPAGSTSVKRDFDQDRSPSMVSHGRGAQ